jgi:GT2 family glycosyltransferase/glycosyltransferase involved in cell wall biosynthesis
VTQRVKIAFGSGSEDLIPTLIEKMSAIEPDLPLYVVSEFPPEHGRWIRWYPAKDLSENAARIEAALAGCEVVYAGIILQPRMPYWKMRWAAIRRWPWRLMAFNENLDHFMLRPAQAPVILRHYLWRAGHLIRWETRPGGGLYTLIWRLFHPWAFGRPIAYRAALVSGWLARRWRRAQAVVDPQTPAGSAGVSVVIPSRNGRDLLERLLRSFAGQMPEEIIVVDNGSSDGTARWLQSQHPEVRVLVSSTPLSFAAAVNRGIDEARFDKVCLLNNDMVIEDGFFAALREPFSTIPGLFASTAQILFPEGLRREETGKAMYHGIREGRFPISCDVPLQGEDGTWVLYGSGGCTLYDTAKLRALGRVGEQYTPAYVEDLDLGWRAWLQGWPTVFAAGARVLHLHRTTTSKYYQPFELECALERNYIQFAAASASARVWREAIDRVNLLAARQDPVKAAASALYGAWKQPWRQQPAGSKQGMEDPIALCSGRIAVVPGRASANQSRVLVVAPYLPFPLSHGGAVRMFNLMREAAKDFDVLLLVFTDALETPAPELLAICCEIVLVQRSGSHLLPSSPRPDVVEEHDTPEFRAALNATMAKWRPELVQLEFTQMGLYAGQCRPARTLLVEHDITFDLYQQLLAEHPDYDTREQCARWLAFEKDTWRRVDAVVTMSEKDRAAVGSTRAHTIGNGVDLQRFTPDSADPEPGRLLFIGSFAHLPNVIAIDWFLREVWPLLQDHALTLHIIAGQRHTYYLERYADRVRPPMEQPRVEVEGFVSDVRIAYRRAAIVIAPLVASAGTNIKIMEAMAMGKAIASTPAGINGLELVHGRDLLVASTQNEMAAAIARLAADPLQRKQLEVQARATVESAYSWESMGRRQRDLYHTLIQMNTLH